MMTIIVILLVVICIGFAYYMISTTFPASPDSTSTPSINPSSPSSSPIQTPTSALPSSSVSTPTLIPSTTPTLTPSTSPTPTSSISPTLSPTPSSIELTIQERIRDEVMDFIKFNHPETAQFMTELNWTGGRVTPQNLVGAETYLYCSQGWNITISYPVVLNPVYNIVADYSTPIIGIPYRIIWQGTWQSSNIIETSYVLAQ